MKILSVFIIGCFFNLVLAVPLWAERLYQDTSALSREAIFQRNANVDVFDVRLKEIRGKQASGRAIFYAGVGLTAAYAYTILFSKTKEGSLAFLFGIPLVSLAMSWYGFSETVAANHEEAVLMYQKQMKGTEEAK